MGSAVLAGALFGALNLAHCASMCGPLAAVSCELATGSARSRLLRYQLGRWLAYGFAGALAGHVGSGLSLHAPAWANWVFATLAASACLFAARGLMAGRSKSLVQLRTKPQPKASLLARVFRLFPREPLVLGLLSLLLPCGLLAAALLAAVSTGSAVTGLGFMLSFAAVSGVAVLGAGSLVRHAPKGGPIVRNVMAALLVAGAAAVIAGPIRAAHTARDSAAVSSTQPVCH